MNKKYLLIITGFILLVSCATIKKNNPVNISGTYKYKTFSGLYDRDLILDSNGNFICLKKHIEDTHMGHPHCDTIAIGRWKHKDNLLYLSSYPMKSMLSGFINVNSKEIQEKGGEQNDSTYFYIESPIENYFKETGYRFIHYQIYGFADKTPDKGSIFDISFNSNHFAISKKKLSGINILNIQIFVDTKSYPFQHLEFFKLSNLDYEVKNNQTNKFVIKIPDLTKSIFCRKRLNGDIVQIIDKNTLLWDNKRFLLETYSQ